MQPAPGNVSVGDVYIFEGEEIIGVVNGLKFQNIPRRALNVMLPPGGAKAVTTRSSTPATKSQAPVPPKIQLLAPPKPATGHANKEAKMMKPTKVVARKQVTNTMSARVMNIIAVETDVDMSELVDDAAFENLGVDSLMSLTISAKFREDLELEISSTLFTDYPTVGQMKRFFAQYDGVSQLEESVDTDDESEPHSYIATPYEGADIGTPISSPPSSAPSVSGKEMMGALSNSAGNEASLARRIIAEEMGVGISDIADQADLSELGMDSLMSLTILSSLRENTGIDLPSTFLVTNATIEDVENALGMRQTQKAAPKVEQKAQPEPVRHQLAEVSKKLLPEAFDLSSYPPATSVLLQGNAKIATKKLFLFPDGSGSATSYVTIPNISPDVAVYGLNCPFMKNPTSFTCGIDGVSAIYLAEMRRRQPHGPYIIGGWSAGGVVAYEVATQLLAIGETVEKARSHRLALSSQARTPAFSSSSLLRLCRPSRHRQTRRNTGLAATSFRILHQGFDRIPSSADA